MLLQYFVTENKTGACIPVEITPATQSDLLVTKSGWQSDWTSDFIRDSQLEKRVAKAASGEIIALGGLPGGSKRHFYFYREHGSSPAEQPDADRSA